MANNYLTTGLTGVHAWRKAVNHGVCSLTAPVVTQVALEKKADPINNATISGKQRGAMVIHEATAAGKALSLCVSKGSKEDAVWATKALATAVTPA